QRFPAGDLAGHRDGEPAVLQALGVRHAIVEIAILRGTGRRPLPEVEREGATAHEPAQRESAPADPARRRVHDAPGGSGRDGCIDGAAALAQDLRARFGGKPMLGGDGADAGVRGERAGEGAGAPSGESEHRPAATVPYQQQQTLAAAAACAKGARAMAKPPRRRQGVQPYGEKEFYLEEFRGRSVLIAVAPAVVAARASLKSLGAAVTALVRHDTLVILWWPHVVPHSERPLLASVAGRGRSDARTASDAVPDAGGFPRRSCAWEPARPTCRPTAPSCAARCGRGCERAGCASSPSAGMPSSPASRSSSRWSSACRRRGRAIPGAASTRRGGGGPSGTRTGCG